MHYAKKWWILIILIIILIFGLVVFIIPNNNYKNNIKYEMIQLYVGETFPLYDNENLNFVIISDEANIIQIIDNEIIAVNPGFAKIKSNNGSVGYEITVLENVQTNNQEEIKAEDEEPKEVIIKEKTDTKVINISLYVNEEKDIVLPEKYDNQDIIWESSNENIIKVDSRGIIKGVNEGTAKVTAKSKDMKEIAVITVVVQQEKIKVESIKIDRKEEYLEIGKSLQLVANVLPENATNKAILWTSSDSSIVEVDSNGLVKALKEGKAIITAKTVDQNKEAKVTINVSSIEITVDSITLNKTNEILEVGSSTQLSVTILPTNATDKSIKWFSSDETIATVNTNGVVKALKEGKTTITAKTVNNKTATYNLTVKVKQESNENIEITEPITDSRIKDGVLNLYVSTTGNDKNDGTKNKPLKTLHQAYAIQLNLLKTNKADVIRIHIASGNYSNQFLNWNWCAENSTIRIYGDGDTIPVFNGNKDNSFFMTLKNSNNCKYVVYNIKIQNYENGIKIYSKDNNYEGNNIIDNVHFYKIGDYYVDHVSASGVDTEGVAGVDLMYSSNNIVRNCSFDHLINLEAKGNHIHGVYMAYGSSNNRIYNNTFSYVKPDPIRFRDRSNNNRVAQNTFTNSGVYAYCSEWHSVKKNETISEGNIFYNNQLNSGYSGSQIDEIAIFEPDKSNKLPLDASRLKAYGNTKK